MYEVGFYLAMLAKMDHFTCDTYPNLNPKSSFKSRRDFRTSPQQSR